MPKKVNIIGAGIAGLSAGCYLQMKGFDTEIFEMHSVPGGLCTSWKKGDYTIDGCLHWLVGSAPGDPFYELWNELIDLDKITFVDYDEYFRISDEVGNEIIAYTDILKTKEEFLAKAPEDKALIESFVKAVLKISGLKMPVSKAQELFSFWDKLKMFWEILPYIGLFGKYSKMLAGDFAAQAKNPLLKKAFEFSFMPEMPFIFNLMTFAWFHKKSAGYPVGGSLAFSRLIEKKYLELGGKIQYHSRVNRIITEPLPGKKKNIAHRAKGIELESGQQCFSDITVSCADGHATVFDMLEGQFVDDKTRNVYETFKVFPSFLQISLGINKVFDKEPHSVVFALEKPYEIDPEETTDYLSYRIMNFDPTLAPEGKTLVTATVYTYNYRYWYDLRKNDRTKYKEEKERVGNWVIDELDKRLSGLKENLEMTDISSPATVIRYTNNWKGSFEGWLMNRETGFDSLPKSLGGLKDFYMAGHWVEPGGGVPAALLSARNLSQIIEKTYR